MAMIPNTPARNTGNGNFNFTSPVTELSVQLVYNPLGKNDADKGFAPYLFAGGGLAFLNIKRNWQGINGNTYCPNSAKRLERTGY
ncbi:MAG: hypothetical protein IPP73_17415 [Chitinophagaceae bacterium]|nr:hypothetical protein [Chitinophagaceae bacterium]